MSTRNLRRSSCDGDGVVEFDRVHLNQVLWNLCAQRVAPLAAGARQCPAAGFSQGVSPRIARDRRRPRRGEGCCSSQLFEPFFTTYSAGTGLGLYIARELCAANGASARLRRSRRGRPTSVSPGRECGDESTGTPVAVKSHSPRGRRRGRHPRAARADPDPHGPRGRIGRHRSPRRSRSLKQHSFDLCLTDMRLPDGDGLELVRYIGARLHRPSCRGDHGPRQHGKRRCGAKGRGVRLSLEAALARTVADARQVGAESRRRRPRPNRSRAAAYRSARRKPADAAGARDDRASSRAARRRSISPANPAAARSSPRG